LYRFDVCIIAFARPEGVSYWPSWIELAVSVGIVSAAALVFIFFVENLKVYTHDGEAAPHAPSYDPATLHVLTPAWLSGPRRYSLALITAAAVAFALLPDTARFGATPDRTPVWAPRTVNGTAHERTDGAGTHFLLVSDRDHAAHRDDGVRLIMIDGNRDGRFVLFPHERHVAELGDAQSCAACHHQNLPFDEDTSCHECHRDMYEVTDIFAHASHVEKLDGNRGCVECHADGSAAKTRSTSVACIECHADMVVAGSRVDAPDEGLTGYARGYMDVMHELCITCHKEKQEQEPDVHGEAYARCDGCHGIMNGSDLKAAEPYARAVLASMTRQGNHDLQ
jgi:class III cytochrome C family protein